MCTNTNFSHCSLLGRRSRDAALPLRQLVRRRVPHKSQGPGLRLMRAVRATADPQNGLHLKGHVCGLVRMRARVPPMVFIAILYRRQSH